MCAGAGFLASARFMSTRIAHGHRLCDPVTSDVEVASMRHGTPLKHGTIVRMVPEQGFGFVRSDEGHEYFFHRGALNATRFDDLAPGTTVEFRIGEEAGDRADEGLRAVFVRLAGAAEPAVDLPLEAVDHPMPEHELH
jgi:cold shock CspA family protein